MVCPAHGGVVFILIPQYQPAFCGIFFILNILLRKKLQNLGLSTTTNFISCLLSIPSAAVRAYNGYYHKHHRCDHRCPALRQNYSRKQSQSE